MGRGRDVLEWTDVDPVHLLRSYKMAFAIALDTLFELVNTPDLAVLYIRNFVLYFIYQTISSALLNAAYEVIHKP